MIRRTALCLLVMATLGWAQPGVIRVNVDARDAPRKLIHVALTMPAAPGPMTLLYPQWIPGEHGPTGPIADLVNLRIRANSHVISWKRDSINLFAFHVDVPAGSSALDITFDFISPLDAAGFSGGSSMTTELAVISWNQLVLYPQGPPAADLSYQAKLRLPSDWHYGTALPVARESGDEIEFRPVPLTMLIDSPVSAGAHDKTVDFGTVDGAGHSMHIVSDNERAIVMPPEIVRQYQNLIAEAGAMFGSRHYRSYHFLLTLSDHVASFGLEHHESSDDRLDERALTDEAVRQYHAELLPHEYVHSWNGKYRRPAGLVTKDYSEPMKGDLLWIYEGLTEYLGAVLSARSGMETPELFRDRLAFLEAHLQHETGRNWRSLEDTAISAQILYGARADYAGLRRGIDFYGEAELVWLDVDTTIRELSKGRKSIDDFCRAFYAGQNGVVTVIPYTLDDVTAALNLVQPYDWAGFFRKRVQMIEPRAPIEGLERGGWKITYNGQRSDYWNAEEDQEKITDLTLSLGVVVKSDGVVQDVEIGGPVQKAGIAPGARITSVNGRQFTADLLRDAVQTAANSGDPIEIVVKNGGYFSTHSVDYHDGEKYPHMERVAGKTDWLAEIVRSRTATGSGR